MNKPEKIGFLDLIEIKRKISNPFSREIFISTIKKEYGEGYTIFYDLGNGIAVYVRNFIPKKDILLVEECNVSGGSLIFNLSANNIKFIYKDKKEFTLKKSNFLLGLSSNDFYVEVPLKKDEPIIEFAIGIKEELFLQIASCIKNIKDYMKKAYQNSYHILYSSQIDGLQYELFNYFKDEKSFEDILKSIYLESKTTNLIHYTIERIGKNLDSSFKNNKILYLERAKDIIVKEYSSNLSIKDIAYKSAINECYLKKDFKEYFGMTILQMLQERRLEVAKQLLKDDLSVKEVALKVGYKHTGHFSKLFFDYFKISPSAYRKQLNNF